MHGSRLPADHERKLPFIRELKTFMEGVKLDGAALAPVDLDGLMNSLDRIKSKMLTADDVEKWDRKDEPPLEMMGWVRSILVVSLTLLPALLTVAARRPSTTEEERNVVSGGEL